MERFDAIYEDGVIKPAEPLPLPDRAEVEVTVVSKANTNGVAADTPGNGLHTSAGAWADEVDALDEYLANSREARHADRPESES